MSNLWFMLLGHSYFAPKDAYNPFLHTWSLGVEEQFYLVIPVLYLVLQRVGRRWQVPALTNVVLAVLGAASLALAVVTTRGGTVKVGPWVLHNADVAFYSPATRAWEFLAGFVVAGIAVRGSGRANAVVRGVAAVVLAGCFALYLDTAPFLGWRAVVPVAATVALLVTGQGAVSPFLSWPPLVAIGDMSYSLYLWHWPALVLARSTLGRNVFTLPAALAVAAACATASYRWIEVPGRVRRQPRAWRTVGTVGACAGLPIALAAGLITASPVLARARHITVPDPADFTGAKRPECADDVQHNPWNRDDCVWGNRPDVFLVGDSHAWMIAPMVLDAARATGHGFATWSHYDCPFATAIATRPPGCGAWQADAIATVLREHPALVVIANRSTGYTLAPGGETRDVHLPGQAVPRTETAALKVWDQALRAVVTRLTAAGIPVLLFGNTPEFPSGANDGESFLHPGGLLYPQSVAEVTARSGHVAAVERAIVASTPETALFDPVPYLCVPECRQYDGGRWMYFDSNHLTVDGTAPLLEPFTAAVRAATG